MLKNAIGDEKTGRVFSTKFALRYFMGWDEDMIAENQACRLEEEMQEQKFQGMLEKIKESVSVDISGEGTPFEKSLR